MNVFLHLNPGARRMLCLVSAMIVGSAIPVIWGAAGTFLHDHGSSIMPPMIMCMLLFAFIDVHFNRESVGWSHVRIPCAMVAVAVVSCFLIRKFTGNSDFAAMAFLIGMTPTANAAPVITGLLGRREDYATVSVVSTNLFVAFALAPIAALVLGSEIEFSTTELAAKTMLLVGVPFVVATILRNFAVPAANFVRRVKFLSFYLWMTMLGTICAQSSNYICTHPEIPVSTLAEVFLLAAVMCALNFALGYFLGEKRFRRECSQSLGQKNTMLMLWVAVAFFNPLVALGPTFYVVCHNLWNSWQLRLTDKHETTIK